MTFELPKIYPITDTSVSGLSHLDQLERLIAGGARLIQLRDKTASPREFCDAAAAALKKTRASGVKLIVNDRVDIALVIGADGVHLGQDDLPPEKAREILGPKAIIGFSTHTAQQAAKALLLPVDYIAIGPIFPTTTKENPDPVTGLNILREVREIAGKIPLVAIGGITADNVSGVFEAGADSAAVIGYVLSDQKFITERMRELTRMSGIV